MRDKDRSVFANNEWFSSKAQAAKSMVEDGMPVIDVAKILGLTYSTVACVTLYRDKCLKRKNEYRAISLYNSSRHYTKKEIAARTGITISTLNSILKKHEKISNTNLQ